MLSLRGWEEHIHLIGKQFESEHGPVNNRKFIKFTSRIRENSLAGLKQSKKAKNLTESTKDYDQPENNCSIFKLYKKYLILIQRRCMFYRKSIDRADANKNQNLVLKIFLRENWKSWCRNFSVKLEFRQNPGIKQTIQDE